MLMRVMTFIITAVIQIAAAAAGFLLLLLGLNGYSERQATPSLIFYILLSLGEAVGLGIVSALVAKRLVERKSLHPLAASAIAVTAFSILGVLSLFVLFFVALMLAEFVRGMR